MVVHRGRANRRSRRCVCQRDGAEALDRRSGRRCAVHPDGAQSGGKLMRIETHWPLALCLILIAGFGAWVFIHSNRSYLLRWALIPISLVVAVLSSWIYDAGLGYAVAAELPEKFVYLGHQ